MSIVYKGYPLPTLEFQGTYNTIRTNIDINGNPITTTYTYPSNYTLDTSLRGCTVTQGALVNMPMPEVIFGLREIIGAGMIGTNPANASQMMTYYKGTYEGKINSATWTLIAGGFITGAKHTWLIEKVDGTSKDAGQSYEAYWQFHYRSTTWDENSTYIDPKTGDPPPDLAAGGVATSQVRAEVAFPSFTFGPN